MPLRKHQCRARRSRFLTVIRWAVFLAALLFNYGSHETCDAQSPVTGTCVAFAEDGALARGTLRSGELEIALDENAGATATTQIPVARIPVAGLPQLCEEAFSSDGKWLAAVVPSSNLTMVVLDRKTKTVHCSFSSEWRKLDNTPLESMYQSSFLGGFQHDDALVLWRYVPRFVADGADGPHTDLHLQRWSVDGQLLSDLNLGEGGHGSGGRQPLALSDFHKLWIPDNSGTFDYRGVKVSGEQIEGVGTLGLPRDNAVEPAILPGDEQILTVLGKRTAQEAALLNSSGDSEAQQNLPFFPNLLGPFVPDWFQTYKPVISHDGKVAAVGRTRVAWVLVDTDRDWGSEILLLNLCPLGVTATLKTGTGGIGALAVDHHNGVVRVVGFWGNRWHELRCDDEHPGHCR
jgi:hypothetical protein